MHAELLLPPPTPVESFFDRMRGRDRQRKEKDTNSVSDIKSEGKSVTVVDSADEDDWKTTTFSADALDPGGVLRFYLSIEDESGWGGKDYVHWCNYR